MQLKLTELSFDVPFVTKRIILLAVYWLALNSRTSTTSLSTDHSVNTASAAVTDLHMSCC